MGEYEEIVKKIPMRERAIGPLAGLATRLDYLGPKVQETENTVQELGSTLSPRVADLAEKVGKLEYTLSQLEFPEGVVMPEMKIVQIPFSYNLPALGGVVLSETAPLSGYIKEVSIHCPMEQTPS